MSKALTSYTKAELIEMIESLQAQATTEEPKVEDRSLVVELTRRETQTDVATDILRQLSLLLNTFKTVKFSFFVQPQDRLITTSGLDAIKGLISELSAKYVAKQ